MKKFLTPNVKVSIAYGALAFLSALCLVYALLNSAKEEANLIKLFFTTATLFFFYLALNQFEKGKKFMKMIKETLKKAGFD